jgi:enamine deaminase RidA (YjgF/YER057c/UK114 family)
MRPLALCTVLLAVALSAPAQSLQRFPKADRSGTALAVRVPDGPLVFTGQIADPQMSPEAGAQARNALAALARELTAAGSDLARVVRLNALVGADADVAAVEAAVAERFAATPVAFTLVRTPHATAGVRVSFEAVATSDASADRVQIRSPQAALLPAGGKIFISGQAEKGADVATATRLTMAGLHRTLTHLGLTKADVVQIKVFLTPHQASAAAAREIAASFDGGPVPPTVLVEWVSTLPVEIELVAAARALPTPAGDRVAYLPLPWLTSSPRYSRVCHVGAGVPLIFVGAINGDGVAGSRDQMKAIFERIGSALFECGSSYRNLIKATYYLGDATARNTLGDIRGVYFDPTRAPAASALESKSLGRPGRAAQIDLVAFPVK